jgi:hypothetical protein
LNLIVAVKLLAQFTHFFECLLFTSRNVLASVHLTVVAFELAKRPEREPDYLPTSRFELKRSAGGPPRCEY